jgi:hypothetical protein
MNVGFWNPTWNPTFKIFLKTLFLITIYGNIYLYIYLYNDKNVGYVGYVGFFTYWNKFKITFSFFLSKKKVKSKKGILYSDLKNTLHGLHTLHFFKKYFLKIFLLWIIIIKNKEFKKYKNFLNVVFHVGFQNSTYLNRLFITNYIFNFNLFL